MPAGCRGQGSFAWRAGGGLVTARSDDYELVKIDPFLLVTFMRYGNMVYYDSFVGLFTLYGGVYDGKRQETVYQRRFVA